jgi:hypothetical protein
MLGPATHTAQRQPPAGSGLAGCGVAIWAMHACNKCPRPPVHSLPKVVPPPPHTQYAPSSRVQTWAVLPLVIICSAIWCLGERGVLGSRMIPCSSTRSVMLGWVGNSSGGTSGGAASTPSISSCMGPAAAAAAPAGTREAPTRRAGSGGTGAAELREAEFLGEKVDAMTRSA